LVQVAVNLLNNAAKYTPEGGRILLKAEGRRQKAESEPEVASSDSSFCLHPSSLDVVVFRVSDNGLGIPPERLKHIFDLFTQLDLGTERDPQARARGGLGVGLALVRRLVELHGGTIAARSEGPGKGSEFIVRLPALSQESPDLPADSQTEQADTPAP